MSLCDGLSAVVQPDVDGVWVLNNVKLVEVINVRWSNNNLDNSIKTKNL